MLVIVGILIIVTFIICLLLYHRPYRWELKNLIKKIAPHFILSVLEAAQHNKIPECDELYPLVVKFAKGEKFPSLDDLNRITLHLSTCRHCRTIKKEIRLK